MGKAKKKRERAKRVAQKYKTTGYSPPDRSTKRYQVYFFIRASHVRNNRERGNLLDRFDIIQVCSSIKRFRGGDLVSFDGLISQIFPVTCFLTSCFVHAFQIPDVLRMVPEHRAGTSITNRHAAKKRTIYKKEAVRRGCKVRWKE